MSQWIVELSRRFRPRSPLRALSTDSFTELLYVKLAIDSGAAGQDQVTPNAEAVSDKLAVQRRAWALL
jgi:hypothetical protein